MLDAPLQDIARIKQTAGLKTEETAQVRSIFLGLDMGSAELKYSDVKGKNPFAESLKDLAGTKGVALSFSAKDGVFELVLDVPVEQAKNIAQAASRTRGLFPQ